MTDQKRTLSIEARVRDFMSRNFGVMGRAVTAFGKLAISGFRRILGAIRPMHLAFAGFAALWAGFKGGKTLEEILDAVSTFDKLGDSLHTDVDRMIALQAALELNGVSAEKFTSSMSALGRALAQAFERNDKNVVGTLRRLGIAIEDVKQLDAVALLDRIAKGLESVGSDAEKSAVLAQLFGRGFQVLFVSLAQGQDNFRKLVATAQFFVGTIGEDGAKAAVRLGDALALVKKALEAVGRVALVELARQFAPAVERVAAFFAKNRDRLAKGLAALVEAIVRGTALVGAAFLKLVAFLSTHLGDLVEEVQSLPLVGDLIGKALGAAFDVPQLGGKAKAIRAAALGVADSIVALQNELGDIGSFPQEMDATGERTAALTQRLKELQLQLSDLSAEFAKETSGGAQPVDLDKLNRDALRSANLRNLGNVVQQLGNLENLPGLPPDLPLLVRALFGDGGADDVEAQTTSFVDGVKQGLERVQREWTDFGAAGEEAIAKVVGGGLDGLVDAFGDIIDGTKKASEAFRDYAKRLLGDIARIIAKLTIMKALEQFGLAAAQAKGGVLEGQVESTQRVRKFATGGVAHGPTLALMGEAGRSEAYVPLPDNRSIPVTFTGGGPGGSNVVQITIQAMDSRDVQRLLMEQQGTFLTMITNALENRNGLRHTVRRAVA